MKTIEKNITKVTKTQQAKGKMACSGKLVLLNPTNVVDAAVYINNGTQGRTPAIISETEQIAKGDLWINTKDATLGIREASERDANVIRDNKHIHCKKVLVAPENFSAETLQDIVDGKLNDGDEVFVECIEFIDVPEHKHLHYEIKLTNDKAVIFQCAKMDATEYLRERFGVVFPKTLQDKLGESIPLHEVISWMNEYHESEVKKLK